MRREKREPFGPERYHAIEGTAWTAEQKSKYAKQLVAFVESGFEERRFTEHLYLTVRSCFGHIAHYDRRGFYDYWFSTAAKQLSWVRYVLSSEREKSNPRFTFSDVEGDVREWLSRSSHEAHLENEATAEVEKAERAELARLKAKYEGGEP